LWELWWTAGNSAFALEVATVCLLRLRRTDNRPGNAVKIVDPMRPTVGATPAIYLRASLAMQWQRKIDVGELARELFYGWSSFCR
jgi:hypothetical protein